MTALVPITDQIAKMAAPFDKVNGYGLDFRSEALFARQQLLKNDYSLQAAQNNPNALGAAILNVAAIGISLNPATKHAYLVPRAPKKGAKPEICLDVSYLGLVKLATDSGAVLWAKAELVYESDEFKWRGMTELPMHEFDPFEPSRMDTKDPFRGLRGGYCVAKLPGDTWLIDRMTAAELEKVRETSKASNGPWKTWPEEMCKKTLVKRASKSWPQSSERDRVDEAIRLVNVHEGIEGVEPVNEAKVTEFLNIAATGTPAALLRFMSEADEELQAACYNTAPYGEKTKFKQRIRKMLDDGRAIVDDYTGQVTQLAEMGDPEALRLLDELDADEAVMVNEKLTDITHRQIDALRKQAA